MPLNTADQNPNTFNVVPAKTDKNGSDRGQCSWFERPMTSNVVGDRLQIVDVNMQTFVWNGADWFNPMFATDPLTGAVTGLVGPDGRVYGISRGALILSGAVAGSDSGWVPISDAPERFAYQLDSGSTSTAFSVDISADGSTSIGQAFTGTWASSASAEITFPVMYSNPLAKYFRWNVLSGGPLSVSRGV